MVAAQTPPYYTIIVDLDRQRPPHVWLLLALRRSRIASLHLVPCLSTTVVIVRTLSGRHGGRPQQFCVRSRPHMRSDENTHGTAANLARVASNPPTVALRRSPTHTLAHHTDHRCSTPLTCLHTMLLTDLVFSEGKGANDARVWPGRGFVPSVANVDHPHTQMVQITPRD
jgi:hypothetical protein